MCRVLCVVGHLLLPLTFFFSFKQFSVGYVDKSYFVWGKKLEFMQFSKDRGLLVRWIQLKGKPCPMLLSKAGYMSGFPHSVPFTVSSSLGNQSRKH